MINRMIRKKISQKSLKDREGERKEDKFDAGIMTADEYESIPG